MLHRNLHREGQAVRLGPRGLAAGLLLVGVLVVGVLVSTTSCGASAGSGPSTPAQPSQPAVPSQPSQPPLPRVVSATTADPALAVQGATVSVALPGGHVLATAVGPVVPPFVAPPPEVVTATFTVTLQHATGTVPVRLADFSLAAQTGRVVRPLLVTGDQPPPALATSGRSVSFRLTAVLPTGEGLLVWAPGGKPVVRWDYIVEND